MKPVIMVSTYYSLPGTLYPEHLFLFRLILVAALGGCLCSYLQM